MALKHETFIRKIELIYTRAILLQDHLRKASFLLSFIHKSFQLYGIEQAKKLRLLKLFTIISI